MTRKLVLATTQPGALRDHTLRMAGSVAAYPMGDVLLLRGDVAGLDVGDRLLRASDGALLLAGRDDGVTETLAQHGARVLPPIVWSRGVARVEVALDEGADPRAIAALFPEARILAKTQDKPALPLDGLTEKQARALVTAFEMGYYESPKRVTTGAVAKRLGVGRSTFEGHLSRAERKLLGAMLPLAKERMGALDAAQAFCAFSDAVGYFVRIELAGHAIRRVSLDEDGEPTPPHPYLGRILDHLRTGRDDLADLPLDLDVGDFDREVLDLLRKIPPGKTMTYGEIAKALGKPGASRAVGNACAHNPAIIVVPCHRVVPASGGLGNYSGAGGVATKAKLLARERGEDLSHLTY